MADKDPKAASAKNSISDSQRFKYIGFDVFPGKPKELFKSDSEKEKLVDAVKARREKGDVIRDECLLLGERISLSDRIVGTVACLVMVAALFFPWYSAYNEIVEESQVPMAAATDTLDDSLADSLNDSLAMAGMEGDSAMLAAATEEPVEAVEDVEGEEIPEEESVVEETGPKEEVIHGYVAKKKVRKDYSRVSGLGSFGVAASSASLVFGAGPFAAIIAILLLATTILCVVLPGINLYGLYGLKGTADEQALRLKKLLRFNWIPLLAFVGCIALGFLGGEYSFDASQYFDSLGDGFGIVVFFDSLSWGPFITIAASLLLAVKGVEI